MAPRHPYFTSKSYLILTITQFRKSFPTSVTIETLKKLGLAPNNEGIILNILRFLSLIDEEGNRTEAAQKIFSLQDNAAFANEFEKIVSFAYTDLFELYGDATWELDSDGLTTFFRTSDGTSERVGNLQTSTFLVLANFSGHGEISEPTSSKQTSVSSKTKTPKGKPQTKISKIQGKEGEVREEERSRDFGLTVRIEINLPANGSQETYDRIFRSIRDNLLNA